MTGDRLGQATLEFFFSLGLVLVTLTGAGWILRAEWHRTECAYWVFEVTRAALEGRTPPASPLRVVIDDDGGSVSGEAKCRGKSTPERIRFRKLSLQPLEREHSP